MILSDFRPKADEDRTDLYKEECLESVTLRSNGERRSRWPLLAVAVVLVLSVVPLAGQNSGADSGTGLVDIIVRETTPDTNTAEALVTSLGGAVAQNLTIIGGFSAAIPASAIGSLAASEAVAAVTPDGTVRLLGSKFGENTYAADFDGALPHVLRSVGAEAFWASGYSGAGVDVALIDSGVVPVDGLWSHEKLLHGPDLSFESQSSELEHLDTYGHGTHMAGIIAGRDKRRPRSLKSIDDRYFTGLAPEARILSVKVGAFDGAVDVSQVLAAIDWVVQHKDDNGLNVRVLNLSFGTDSSQPYVLDPLAYAVEQAWKSGIVVVVAAGNDGNFVPLRDPAFDPFVIAVGASDTKGTETTADDGVATFSNCDTSGRTVDLVAPGVSIVSLRNPGSYADVTYPSAQVGARFFKGTGTSQAAAVVSGAAALILSKYPSATPDQVKKLLTSTATPLGVRGRLNRCYGAGTLNLSEAANASLPDKGGSKQNWTGSTGAGSLERSRGSSHLENNGVILSGEQDIFGMPFDAAIWAPMAALGTTWSGGDWNGTTWSGTTWSGTTWSGTTWSGTTWSGITWSSVDWADQIWSGTTWSGTTWSGTTWSGTTWSGTTWSGRSWK
jgi:serine protease AprX